MRRRIGGLDGLSIGGNSSAPVLDNTGELTDDMKRMMEEAWTIFPLMKDRQGCDYEIRDQYVKFGIEPSYMYEHMEVIRIEANKENSFMDKGYAVGPWASRVLKTRKYYSDYVRASSFTRFVDRWHPILFP